MLAADRSEEGLCPAGFVTSAKFDYACYIWQDVVKYRVRPLSFVEFLMAYVTMGTPRFVARGA